MTTVWEITKASTGYFLSMAVHSKRVSEENDANCADVLVQEFSLTHTCLLPSKTKENNIHQLGGGGLALIGEAENHSALQVFEDCP